MATGDTPDAVGRPPGPPLPDSLFPESPLPGFPALPEPPIPKPPLLTLADKVSDVVGIDEVGVGLTKLGLEEVKELKSVLSATEVLPVNEDSMKDEFQPNELSLESET